MSNLDAIFTALHTSAESRSTEARAAIEALRAGVEAWRGWCNDHPHAAETVARRPNDLIEALWAHVITAETKRTEPSEA